MENYTKEEIIQELLSLNLTKRNRDLVDKRSYLIALLAFKFYMSEHAIAKILNIKREKIHYNKKLARSLIGDDIYNFNVSEYLIKYPFDFGAPTVRKIYSNKNITHRVNLSIDDKLYKKLKAAGDILNHSDIRITIKLLLEKSLTIWQ